ncbi:hypothetical protein ACSLBF_08010 [Pseudoalteromonas sp. T1lg65]|uniref:hypothetical protein n=1 Tax=Pseudoalteromonas sp. T1lg65 TaxID=2077101 RepID=UPI003F7A6932
MLSPNPTSVKMLLTNFFVGHHKLNCAALALRYVHLYNPATEKPSWYNQINQQIHHIQPIAGNWLLNDGPSILAGLTQQFIHVKELFRVFVDSTNTSNIQNCQLHLHWLRHHVGNMSEQASHFQNQLQPFVTQFSAQKSSLEHAIAEANLAIQGDRNKVNELKNRISQLYQKISSQTAHAEDEMMQVTSSGAAASFALLTYGFEVALAVGAQSFPIVGLGVALGGLTYNAIMNAIHQNEVIEELHEIGRLKQQLLSEEQEIAALQIISEALTQTERAIEHIQNCISFAPTWQTFEQQLNQLHTQLAQPGVNPQNIEAIRTLPQALLAWDRIATMSTNVQLASSGFSSSWHVNLNHLQ